MKPLSLPIKTERLVLRTLGRDDLEQMNAYYVLPEVQRYLHWKARDAAETSTALDAMMRHVSLQRPGDMITLAIVLPNENKLIGQVSFKWSDATAAQGEIRFVLNPLYTGQGYAKEAVSAMIDLAFDHYNMHRVFARCDARNHRSAKLLQTIGMRLEAHYREHALFQGEWDEELHFAILDREWHRSSTVRELRHTRKIA